MMKLLNQIVGRLNKYFCNTSYLTTRNFFVLCASQNRSTLHKGPKPKLSSSYSLPKRFISSHFVTMADDSQYVGTSARGITKEIEIHVPWGIVAGKTYGESCNPPVLCVHGWLDNCNTFDTLIPMLPKDRFYVFIDLPGHGKSSGIQIGCFYTIYDYIALVHRIADYFSWPFFSFLSHSLGGSISAVYAGTFPEKVDKLILLDCPGIFASLPGREVTSLRSSIESYTKFEKELDRAASTYSYEEAKKRLLKANDSLTGPAADILLERGTARQEDGTCKFVRDIRHIFRNPTSVSASSGILFMSSIRAETAHLIAKDGPLPKLSEQLKEMFLKLQESFKSCEYHLYEEVDGLHHLHLCEPDNVIGHISAMLNRPKRSGLLKKEDSSSN